MATTIRWTITSSGESYGPEEMTSDAFERYVEIERREISTEFPEYEFQFDVVPETYSHNNRPYVVGSMDEEGLIDTINAFVSDNYVNWLEEAGA